MKVLKYILGPGLSQKAAVSEGFATLKMETDK